jgi:uncharacterized delta-60 repeat protein
MSLKFTVLFLLLFGIADSAIPQWTSVYNYGINDLDYPKAIAVDQSGFTYVAGTNFTASMEANYLLIKYSPAGDTVWTRQYDGNISGQDEVTSIAIDNQSNVIITGKSESITGYDIVTFKYNSNGIVLWGMRYNGLGSGSNDAFAVSTDDSLNVYVSGKIQISSGVSAFVTLKYDKNGILKWAKQFSGNNTGANAPGAMKVNKSSGNIYITGYVSTLNQGKDIAILKYNRSGSLLWQRIINGNYNGDDVANAITIDSAENVYVTGYVTTGANNNVDFITAKYNTNGDSLWTKYYSGTAGGADVSRAITADNQGNIFVTGESFVNSGLTSNEMVTICYGSTGSEKWVSHYNKNNGCCNHFPVSMLTDNNGNIIVCGKSNGENSFDDFIVLKYNATSGIQTGIYRYRFTGSTNNDVNAMAVDQSGNCYLTGTISFTGAINIGTIKILNSTIGIKTISETTDITKLSLNNYPNPFNSFTKIVFEVPASEYLTFDIFDLAGRSLKSIRMNNVKSGMYEYLWNAEMYPSGIYFCKILSDKYSEARRILLIK